MIDQAEVIGYALEDFAVAAVVNDGPAALVVIPHLDDETVLEGEMVVRSGPWALASAATVAALDLAAGNEGDTLTIGGIDYTVLAIDPDGQGGVVLSLLEVV